MLLIPLWITTYTFSPFFFQLSHQIILIIEAKCKKHKNFKHEQMRSETPAFFSSIFPLCEYLAEGFQS